VLHLVFLVQCSHRRQLDGLQRRDTAAVSP
jgi:hypothetical protein